MLLKLMETFCQFITGEFVEPNVWLDMEKFTAEGVVYSKNGTINNGKILSGTFIEYDIPLTTNVAYFSGKKSGILVDNLQNTCFLTPTTCSTGYTLAFWIKWLEGVSYIFSSSAFNIKHFTPNVLPIEVWDGSNSWSIFHDTSSLFNRTDAGGNPDWHFYTIGWNKTCLTVFVNASETNTYCATNPYTILIEGSPIPNRLAIGTTAAEPPPDEGVNVMIDDVMIWDTALLITDINLTFHAGLNKPTPNYQAKFYRAKIGSTKIGFKDHALEGKVFDEKLVSNVNECFVLCQQHGEACHSFNFQYKGNTESKSCQINSVNKDEIHAGFHGKDGFIYFDII